MAQTIQVMARLRPLLTREEGEPELVEVDGNAVYISNGAKVNSYKFDTIFGKESDQKTVFESTVPYIECALEGLNATVFTYGQTGTGKTHTMLGHDLWELAADDAPAAAATPR